MESGRLEKTSDQRVAPVQFASTADAEGAIDLVEIWKVVVRHRWVILGTFLGSLLVAVAYLFYAQPMYKAFSVLLPPQQQNIQALLIDYGHVKEHEFKTYTTESVYQAFLDNLKSRSLRREFFDAHDLVNHYVSAADGEHANVDRIFDTRFNNRLQISIDKSGTSFVTVTFADRDPLKAAHWLSGFIELANRRTILQLQNNVEAGIQAEIDKVSDQISGKLKLAEQRRLDMMVNLREALDIAKSLGLREGNILGGQKNGDQGGLAINTAEMPMYMRGSNALEAELNVLEARKSDEPFISGLRDLQERKAFLESISVDADSLSAVTVDSVAKPPYESETPKTAGVLALAVLLGVAFGVFAAFGTEFVSRFRQRLEQS